jgi:hypothetical protein
MKFLISIFFISISLLAEAASLGGIHHCDWIKSETCSTESVEGCETKLTEPKLGSQVKKDRPQHRVLVALTYHSVEARDNSINRRFHQHRFRINASPVYLSNQVFLI